MDYTGKKCPICYRRFTADDDIVVCPKCGAPYHRSCFEKEGKCIFYDLHRAGESWNDDEHTDNETKKLKKCKFCGHMNDENAVACEQCGRGFTEYPYPDMNMYGQGEEPNQEFGEFPFKVDLMAGVKPDEDFGGVNGVEISKYVKNNTIYYMDIFKKIKDRNKSRFNFSAFFFGGGWVLYRKQYSYGIILVLITAVLLLANSFILNSNSYNTLILDVKNNLTSLYPDGYTRNMVISELLKQPGDKLFIFFLPYLLSFFDFVIRLIIGFRANRMYYKYTLNQIRYIKAKQSAEESETVEPEKAKRKLYDALLERGGTNNAIAICLIVCYLLIVYVPQFIVMS